MDEIATEAPRRSYPTVHEATEFEPSAYRFDGKGGVETLAFDPRAPMPGSDRGFVLIAGSLSSPHFRHWLQEHLEPTAAEGLTAPDPHARCAVIEDQALIVFRIVRSRTDPEDLSKQTMSIWIERNRVIIASKLEIHELVSIGHWLKSKHAPVSPADLIARMGTRAADRMEPLLERLSDRLNGIEDDLMADRGEGHRDELTRIRRSILNLRRLLWPQREVFNTLEVEDLSFLTPRDRGRLRESSSRASRLGDELQVLSDRAALIHEQLLDDRAEHLNRTILVLTAATVVAMPMTVVSGLLGMNVAGIPFQQNPEAFWFVVLGLAAIGAGIVWFMRRRKWI